MYQIYHKNELLLDHTTIHNPAKLPFGLRHYTPLDLRHIERWIEQRVNNLHRTYMNIYYKYRGVARTAHSVIRDSGGISIADQLTACVPIWPRTPTCCPRSERR